MPWGKRKIGKEGGEKEGREGGRGMEVREERRERCGWRQLCLTYWKGQRIST
jgi:hypothetical protein